jgi:hypothetical protein
MCLRAQLIHYGDRHAVPGNGKESDLTTVSIDLSRDGLPGGMTPSARRRQINYRDPLHGHLLATAGVMKFLPFTRSPRSHTGKS